MKKITKNLLVLASSTVMMTGCTSVMKKNEAQADADIKKTEKIYTDAQIKKPDSLVTVTNQVYLTHGSYKIEKVKQLPTVFKQHITYTASSTEDVVHVLNNISKMLKIEVRISDDAAAKLLKANSATSKTLKNFDGTFSNILNEMMSKEGIFWNYQGGILNIFLVETKVYALDAPISTYSINNRISSNSEAGGSNNNTGGTSSSGTSAMDLTYDVKTISAWDAAINTIKNMLSANGKLDTNPVEGYVTITDDPNRQRAISEYINKINEKTGKKIAIRVDVYDVKHSSGGSMGINMNAIIKAFSGEFNIASSAMASVSGGVDGANKMSFQQNWRSDPTAVLTALNTIGKTTQVTGTTIYTISGQPAPVQNSVQTNYLKSVTSTRDDTGATTMSAETGTVSTGYSMLITPRIESNNQVLISLNLQISSLLKLENYSLCGTGTTNCQQLQLPEVHTKNFLESMILKSGQSILIAGFQDDAAAVNTNSMGDPSTWLLGGSKATMGAKSTTIVVVTPYLIS